MKSIRQVLGQLTTVLTIEMAYLGNSIVESLNINIHTGKAGPGGKDSPAWEPDAMTKVHNDTSINDTSIKGKAAQSPMGQCATAQKGVQSCHFFSW